MFAVLRCTQRSRFGLSRQQHQAQGRRPAVSQRMQVVRPSVSARVQLLQPGQHVCFVEGQLTGAQFEQLALQQQTGKVTDRPPPAAQPPTNARRGHHQQLIEVRIEGEIRLRRVVIEHDPQRPRLLRQGLQYFATAEICGVIKKFAELLRQLFDLPAFACTAQPEHMMRGRTLTGAIGQQHGFTKPGRTNQQTQAAVMRQQPLLQG